MAVQFKKKPNKACMEGLPGEILFCLKTTWKHGLGLQSYIRTNHKACGIITLARAQCVRKSRVRTFQ